MTIDGTTIEASLSRRWPGTVLAAAPAPLSGGFWASMYRLELRGQPPPVPATVVLRIAPDSEMGAKELAVQQAIADQGYTTPRIRLAQRDDPALGGSWTLMDFATGKPPLDGLDGMAALRRAPGLMRAMPGQLACAMAELHALDPEPATAAVRAAAPSVGWTVEDLLPNLEAGALAVGRPDIVAALKALAGVRPPERSTVICHGDLHPFNLLVDATAEVTVIDWTAAVRADPAYDVAFTSLLLSNPPLDATGLLGRIAGPIGGAIARRFVKLYRRANPEANLGDLAWYRALHGTRILVEYASLQLRYGTDAGGHPFRSLAPAAAAALWQATDMVPTDAR